MLTTIKGYYDNGQVFLNEESPVIAKTNVFITFLSDDAATVKPVKRVPGGLKGKLSIPDDFNAPLDDLNDYI